MSPTRLKSLGVLLAPYTVGDWKEFQRAYPDICERIADARRELYYEELDARPLVPLPEMGVIVHDEGEEPDTGP